MNTIVMSALTASWPFSYLTKAQYEKSAPDPPPCHPPVRPLKFSGNFTRYVLKIEYFLKLTYKLELGWIRCRAMIVPVPRACVRSAPPKKRGFG